MFPFLVLSLSVLYLTIRGAGVFSGATLFIGCFLSLCLAILCHQYPKYLLPSTGFSFTIIIWLLFTVTPQPLGLEKFIDTDRIEQNELVREALIKAESLGIIDKKTWHFSITRNRAGTIRSIVYLLGLFSSFAIASTLSTRWKHRYIRFLIILVSSIALLGFIGQHVILQGQTIWWSIPIPWGEPVACFVNRSHFGGFIVLLCPAAVVYFARGLSQQKRAVATIDLFCFFIMTIAVVGSRSRGAFLVYSISLVLIGILSAKRKQRSTGIAATLLGCLSFLLIGLFTNNSVDERIQKLRQPSQDHSAQSRYTIWKDSMEMWRDYPISGVGADGFRTMYPQYGSLVNTKMVTHAESKLIQFVVDYGLIGLLLLCGLIFSYSSNVKNCIKKKLISSDMAISVIAALVVASIHALFEVALTIPLYSFVLCSMSGLLVTPIPRNRIRSSESIAKAKRNPWFSSINRIHRISQLDQEAGLKPAWNRVDSPTLIRIFSIVSIAIFIATYSIWNLDFYKLDKSYFLAKADPDSLAKALVYAPTSWEAWFYLGKFGMLSEEKEYRAFSERCFQNAALYHPNHYMIWYWLHRIRTLLGDKSGAAEALRLKDAVTPPHILAIQEDQRKKFTIRKRKNSAGPKKP